MSSDYYIPANLREKESVLLYPIVGDYAQRKVEEKVVFIDRNLPKIIASVYYAFPMFVPEYGVVVSLDVTSYNYAKRIYYEISPDEIYGCTVHNYRAQENRMVSWNTFEKQHIGEKFKKILHQNIINELKITPSLFVRGEIVSPTRWFCIYIHCGDDKNYLNYNVGIVYLKKEWLKNVKKVNVRVRASLILYEVNSKYVFLSPDGRVDVIDVKLHFLENPEKIFENSTIVDEKDGEYFIASLISYNDGKAPVNIVNRLDPLGYSAYDILPFLFPYLVEPEHVKEPVYQFSVSKSAFRHILQRFLKFSNYPLDPKIIEGVEREFFSKNRLIEIHEREGSYIVKVANPSLITLIIKNIHLSESNEIKRFLEKLMNELLQGGLEALREALKPNKGSIVENLRVSSVIQKTKEYSALREKYVSAFKDLNKLTSVRGKLDTTRIARPL